MLQYRAPSFCNVRWEGAFFIWDNLLTSEVNFMSAILIYIAAAVAEIAGCFAFWAWLRLGKSIFWLIPGSAALMMFALLLSFSPAAFAGRAFAAYGGVYIAASLGWLWLIEGHRPLLSDFFGAAVTLSGAGIILYGARFG